MSIHIPRRNRGKQSAKAKQAYQAEVRQFCDDLLQIDSSLDFAVSSRGWCYLLEEYGLTKGEFATAEKLINDCRKSSMLPVDICSVDDARSTSGIESVDNESVKDYADWIMNDVIDHHVNRFQPFSVWEDQDYYVEVFVEKKDLVGIFKPVCDKYNIPLTNFKGWGDIHSRAAMLQRFVEMEMDDKQCVILYCGDHDPGGLSISDSLHNNLIDVSDVHWKDGQSIGHFPNIKIERFGLNFDFIEQHKLSWVTNLITGSGKNLASPLHPDNRKYYVQSYLQKFGARKVEANALVTRINAGRDLCESAIKKYIDVNALESSHSQLVSAREYLREAIQERLDK